MATFEYTGINGGIVEIPPPKDVEHGTPEWQAGETDRSHPAATRLLDSWNVAHCVDALPPIDRR